MSQTKKRGLAAFALAILLLALVVAIALRATPQGTAAAQTAPIRLSPASQHGVQLISAEAISGVNDSVRLAFRNVSGRPIRSFSFARGETPDPQGYTGSGRSFGDGIEDHSWAPGDETVVLEDRAGDTPIRISAIEFANGEIIGEEYPAASMLENRKAVAEGFASMLADVRARLSGTGTGPSVQRLALQSLRAEIDQHIGKGKSRGQGAPLVLNGPKNKAYLSVDFTLQRLTVEVGEERVLEALATALEAAVKRNKVGH